MTAADAKRSLEDPRAAIRVIVVEDDADLCESLAAYLRLAGMEVRATGSAGGLERALEAAPADVVVLDINLPGETGFAALERLHLNRRAGIVMLTGRSARQDRLTGLSLGADHYLVKPFDMTELALVIRNLHARLERLERPASWSFDPERWVLTSPAGRMVTLSPLECSLIRRLMDSPGCPVSRDDLAAAVQDTQEGPTVRAAHLEVLIFRLRRKVEKGCGCDLPIQSVRGYGYVFMHDAPCDPSVRPGG
ncbi:response regulator transcription factor [Xanthobacter variabilis]|uniref:response regulator transcription factor n=1 Tax=Xanthobacter variabilis TaxID=3119932 RepID=UPI00372B59F9